MTSPCSLARFLGLVFLTACASKGGDDGRSVQRQHEDGGVGNGGAATGGATSGGAGGGGAVSGGTGGTAGPAGTGGATDTPIESCAPGLVWKPTSTGIALRSFGFWEGSMRYEKGGPEMSGEQQSALKNLCLIGTSSQRVADSTSYRLDVEDVDGSVTSYRAAQGDIVDGDEGNIEGRRTISYASLSRFLATFDCKTAKENRGPPVYVDGGDLPDPQSVPSLSTDPGCFDGVFFSHGAGKTYLHVPVGGPGTLRIHEEQCYEQTGLRLFPPEGGEALATSGLVTAPDCPSIEVRVDEDGSYLLEIEKQNIDGTDEGRAGDFYVRMSLTR